MTNKTDLNAIYQALSTIIDPTTRKNIVTLNYIQGLSLTEDGISLELRLPHSVKVHAPQLKDIVSATLKSDFPDLPILNLAVSIEAVKSSLSAASDGLKGVKHIIAVSSCKGGVGKSTIAVNLAFTLSQKGFKVGIFDADVYGPSLPTMVKVPSPELIITAENMILPLMHEGVALMSFGFAQETANETGAAMLRGPMVTQLINQLLTTTDWGDLDYLVLDLPPGTGDVQLTLGQLVPINAAVIVTTPQHISYIDVVKGIEMFDTLRVPTVAVVENMSFYTVNGEKHFIFGKGAVGRLINEFGFKHAFQFPMLPILSESGDGGNPFVLRGNDAMGTLFTDLADAVISEVAALKETGFVLPHIGFDEELGILIKPEHLPGYALEPKALRLNCQCAVCVDEFTGKRHIQPDDIPDTIHPLSMNPVGNYALGINWSDGHSSLYPYSRLEQISV